MEIIKKEVRKNLEDQVQNRKNILAHGTAQNMYEYGRQCGIIEGLNTALEDFNETWKKFNGIDEN